MWQDTIRREMFLPVACWGTYFARVESGEGARFENVVALALQSELDFMKDSLGKDLALQFVRKKDGREIDFVIVERTRVRALIECKWRDGNRSTNFELLQDVSTKNVAMIQLVADLDQKKTFADGCEIRSAPEWLSRLNGVTAFLKEPPMPASPTTSSMPLVKQVACAFEVGLQICKMRVNLNRIDTNRLHVHLRFENSRNGLVRISLTRS